MPSVKRSHIRREELEEMIEKGMTTSEIAKAKNVAGSSVRNAAALYGLKLISRRPINTTPPQWRRPIRDKKKLAALVAAGWSLEELAREFITQPEIVLAAMDKNNLRFQQRKEIVTWSL